MDTKLKAVYAEYHWDLATEEPSEQEHIEYCLAYSTDHIEKLVIESEEGLNKLKNYEGSIYDYLLTLVPPKPSTELWAVYYLLYTIGSYEVCIRFRAADIRAECCNCDPIFFVTFCPDKSYWWTMTLKGMEELINRIFLPMLFDNPLKTADISHSIVYSDLEVIRESYKEAKKV